MMQAKEISNALYTRPLCVVAIIEVIVIVVLRLVLQASGRYGAYEVQTINNPFNVLHVAENDTVVLYGVVDNIITKENVYGQLQVQVYVKSVKEYDTDTAITKAREIVLVNFDKDSDIKIGQSILWKGTLKYHSRATNWGEFDAYNYYSVKGVVCKIDEADLLSKSADYGRVRQCLYDVKTHIGRIIDELYSQEDAAIIKAMIIGIKNEIPDYIKEAFQKSGIAHILAISGLHISFLCMFIYRILDGIRLKRIFCVIISEILLITYIVMVGCPLSAIRAGVMFSVYMISELLKRSYDLPSALALALIIISGLNLWAIFDPSVILSFMAVTGIGIVYKMIINNSNYLKKALKMRDSSRFCKKLVNSLVIANLRNLLATTVVFFVTLPVLLCSYYEIALYSIFLNVIILPFMPLLLFASIGSVMLTALVGDFGGYFASVAQIILAFYKRSCVLLEESGVGRINLGKPAAWQIIFFYILVFIVCIYKYKYSWMVKGICVCLGIWIISISLHKGIYMLDVGQGDCIVVINASREAYIFDAGSSSRSAVGEKVVIPFLKSCGVRHIKGIFISHPDDDHINGIYEIIESAKNECLKVENVFAYKESIGSGDYDKLLEYVHMAKIDISGISGGQSLKNNDIIVQCLYPQKGLRDNQNDNSLVLRIEFDGITMLETGDVESFGEERLGDMEIVADILKVAHHGSSSSSGIELLKRVSPQIALISAGRNNRYGHPHKETLDNLDRCLIPYVCTNNTGAIRINKDIKGIRIRQFVK